MKALDFMEPAQLFIEISQDWLKAFNGTRALELPLERLADGRLTETCKNNLRPQLQGLINRKSWQPRPKAFCALNARGVSLRRLSVPAVSQEELQRLLPLQIESEFPLSPDELAWGYQALNGTAGNAGGAHGKQELLVVAMKKDRLDEYANLLTACGATPVFTLAALARCYVCPQPPGPYGVLTIERNYSELISMDNGVPVGVRVLSWGSENLAHSTSKERRADSSEDAVLLGGSRHEASFGGSGPSVPDPALPINGQGISKKIFVIGAAGSRVDLDFASRLAGRLGDGVECEAVDLPLVKGGSAAILGLQKSVEREDGWPPLLLQAKPANGKERITGTAQLKWAGAALGLLLLALILPYAEALVLKSHVAKKLAAVKTDQGRLGTMDRELNFLQYLKENEPPYLDALLVLAKSAPPGTRFDSVSMNRRGEISLRGSMHDGQQVADLRSKLIDSGFFASVGIDEQTPTPDRQKVNVRLSVQWKPLDSRKTPSLEPARASGGSKGAPHPAANIVPAPNAPPAPAVKPSAQGRSRE